MNEKSPQRALADALRTSIQSLRDAANRNESDYSQAQCSEITKAFSAGITQGFRLSAQSVEREVLKDGWEKFLSD